MMKVLGESLYQLVRRMHFRTRAVCCVTYAIAVVCVLQPIPIRSACFPQQLMQRLLGLTVYGVITMTTITGDQPRLFGDHFLADLDEDELAILTRMRALSRDVFGPQAATVASRDVFAWDTFRTLVDEGMIATAFPRRYGGTDARQELRVRLIEEAGRVCSTTASLLTGADLSARALVVGGSEKLKDEILPRLCKGEQQLAFGLSEPEAGSDVRGLQTRFRPQGDGYVIDGCKKFITRAGVADWIVVVGQHEDTDRGFVAGLVARDTPGLSISPEVGKLGWWGVPMNSLELQGVRLPLSYRLGAEGEGFDLAQDALLRARIGHAAMALGRAIGAVEIASTYACDRSAFGKSLGRHQGVQWMLAQMYTRIEASRALVTMTARKYDRNDADVAIYASMAKLDATDLCMQVATDALQLTGGRGYQKDFPLERFFRDAKLNQIGEGASEVHKTVIGRDVVRRAPKAERNPCLHSGSLVNY